MRTQHFLAAAVVGLAYVAAPSQAHHAVQAQFDVNQTVEMDFRMEVGQVADAIEVSAQAALLQTGDSQVGNLIETRTVVDLPLAAAPAVDPKRDAEHRAEVEHSSSFDVPAFLRRQEG